MEGKITLRNAYGKIIRFVSETLGIIKYKSAEVLFHKDFAFFPSDSELSEECLVVGKSVKFNAKCLKFEDKTFLVATLIWCKKKPTIYEECSLSVYYNYLMENKTVMNDIISLNSFTLSGPHEAVLFPLIHLEEVTSDVEDIMHSQVLKNMVRCLHMGLTGTIKNYLSNDLGVIQCVIDGQTHDMFFSRCTLVCSRDVNEFPLSMIMETCKTFTVDVEVFIHDGKSMFCKVQAVKIEEANIEKLFSLQKYSTISYTNNFFPSFITLQGKICTVSSEIGVIESEYAGDSRLFKFKKKNIDLPYDKYHLPLNKCLSVQSSVSFSVPHLDDLFATAVFINDIEESSTNSNECTQSNNDIKFFECQLLNTGLILGHISDDRGIIMCKILSVDCILIFHVIHAEIYNTHKNCNMNNLFPVDKKVYFDAKISCSGKYLNLDVANVFCVEEFIAVVSEVLYDYFLAVLNKEGQNFAVFVSASVFCKDGSTFMTKENDLTRFVSVGDNVLLEMKVTAVNHNVMRDWVVYKAQKLNSSDLFSVSQTSAQSFNTYKEHGTEILPHVSSTKDIGEKIDSCYVSSDNYLENISACHITNKEILVHKNIGMTPAVVDIQQLGLVQNAVVHRYKVLGLEGTVVRYLTNDLGIAVCKFNDQLQYILLARSSLQNLSDFSSFSLSTIFPLHESFVIDIEVIIDGDKSQFFQVKTVKMNSKNKKRLLHILEDNPTEIHSRIPALNVFHVSLNSFIKLKGKVVSHVSHTTGVIEYTLFGTVKHVNFQKKNTHFYGNKSSYLKLLPCGTEVNFCGMFLTQNCLDSLEVSMVWTDEEIENNGMFPFGDILLLPNINATSFTFQKGVTGTIIGHISDEIGIIRCELLSVNCMVQFHKKDTVMFMKNRNIDFITDFSVGLNVTFNAKILCFEECFNVWAIQVKKGKNLFKGIVSEVCFESLEAIINDRGKQISVTAPNTRFLYSGNIRLMKNHDLRQYVSAGDEVTFEVRELNGRHAWKVYSVQKVGTSVTLQDEVKNLKASVQFVCAEHLVIYEKQFGSLKYIRENITLFGVPLTMFCINELFKEGDVLEFTLCCGEDKLCIGPHHNPVNQDDVCSQLYKYCSERNFRQDLTQSLIESLNSYYITENGKGQLYVSDSSSPSDTASLHVSDKDSVISTEEDWNNNGTSSNWDNNGTPSNSSIRCEEVQAQGQTLVGILHLRIVNIVKSCIEKKTVESERFKMLQSVNINNVLEHLERGVQNSLVDNLLGEAIINNFIQKDTSKTDKGTQFEDVNSDLVDITPHSTLEYENNIVKNVVHDISEYLQGCKPPYSEKSTQTQSTGPVFSLNYVIE